MTKSGVAFKKGISLCSWYYDVKNPIRFAVSFREFLFSGIGIEYMDKSLHIHASYQFVDVDICVSLLTAYLAKSALNKII